MNDLAVWRAVLGQRKSYRGDNISSLVATHRELGDYVLFCAVPMSFCSPRPRPTQIGYMDCPSSSPYVKDVFHSYMVGGRREAVNPEATGTKAAAHYECKLGTGQIAVIGLRLVDSLCPIAYLAGRFGTAGAAGVVSGNGGLREVVVSVFCGGEMYLHAGQVPLGASSLSVEKALQNYLLGGNAETPLVHRRAAADFLEKTDTLGSDQQHTLVV